MKVRFNYLYLVNIMFCLLNVVLVVIKYFLSLDIFVILINLFYVTNLVIIE